MNQIWVKQNIAIFPQLNRTTKPVMASPEISLWHLNKKRSKIARHTKAEKKPEQIKTRSSKKPLELQQQILIPRSFTQDKDLTSSNYLWISWRFSSFLEPKQSTDHWHAPNSILQLFIKNCKRPNQPEKQSRFPKSCTQKLKK